MNSGATRNFNTAGEETTVGPGCHSLFNGCFNAIDDLVHPVTSFGIHGKPSPSHDIDWNRRHLPDFSILNRNEADSFGPCLPDVSPLDAPGEDYMGPLVKERRLVNMAERPVVVAFFDEFVEGAGSVVGMAPHAPKACVQNSDIEIPGNGRGIIGGKVICNISLPKTLAMQDYADLWKRKCLWLF